MPLQAPLKKKAFVQIQYSLKVLFLHIALHFLKQRMFCFLIYHLRLCGTSDQEEKKYMTSYQKQF